jgi:hypothetical protein
MVNARTGMLNTQIGDREQCQAILPQNGAAA